MLDFYPFMPHNRTVAKMTTNQKAKTLVTTRSKEAKMSNANLTVGSQFITQKSGVSGIVQEIVQNKNGTSRVRLSVNGQDRWTTVK